MLDNLPPTPSTPMLTRIYHRNQRKNHRNLRKGALLPLIAVMIIILFVAAVFSVDLARIHVVRSELRTATDAASRAAVEALGRTESEVQAVDAAIRIAGQNVVAGDPLTLDPSNIELGTARELPDGTMEFVPRNSRILNTARVVGSRTNGSPDGPVNMMFGGIFGTSEFQPVQVATSTRLDRDIALVLDKSGSMRSNGRFNSLINGVRVFVDEVSSSSSVRVSVSVYDSSARNVLPLTEDLNLVRNSLDRINPRGATGIGRGMNAGINSVENDPLARRFALKTIIVMTDGNHNRGESPVTVARTAQNRDIVVHTITFSNGANQNLMQTVARIGEGIHLHATNDRELSEAFRTIARQIKVLLIE